MKRKSISEHTNKDIFEMLRSKMERYGLISRASYILGNYKINVYDEDNVQDAIAIAYKSGYMRAMQGRDFEFFNVSGKHGKWVKVDPDNLPPVGSIVRYSRNSDAIKGWFEEWSGFKLGDITTVSKMEKTGFAVRGIKGKNPFDNVSTYAHPDRWDVWVEE